MYSGGWFIGWESNLNGDVFNFFILFKMVGGEICLFFTLIASLVILLQLS